MNITKNKFLRRKKKVRAKVSGSLVRPRLVIFRSNKFIYAQAIDDEKGVTLASVEGKDAKEVGEKMAGVLLKKKVKTAVFDKSGYKYHGKVKAVAEGARKAGLTI